MSCQNTAIYNGSIVACGKCAECVRRRSKELAFRIDQESKRKGVQSLYFVTLTYSPEYVPEIITVDGKAAAYCHKTLWRADYTAFLRRLDTKVRRTNKANGITGANLRYFACGEYGGKHKRPHYHLLAINATFEDIISSWEYGTVYCEPLENSAGTAGYLGKYLNKESTLAGKRKFHKVNEFASWSKGMGSNYLTDAMRQWHKIHLANYILLEGGVKVPLPRYYKDRIFTEQEKEKIRENFLTEADTETTRKIKEIGLDEYKRLRLERIQYDKDQLHKAIKQRQQTEI